MPGLKMTLVSLQMISLGPLFILNAGGSKCISESRLYKRADRFERNYLKTLRALKEPLQPPPNSTTCAQAASEMRGDHNKRSMSPWRYRLDQDANRFPHEISFAECLCQGCIIDQQEDLSYNSVRVFAPMMVLRKTRCITDPRKYLVTEDFIKVSVGCTCVLPK